MFEYKVLTEHDSRFSGKFDVSALESSMNSYAAEGWRLAQSVMATNIMKTSKTELLLILERPRTESE